MKHLFLLKKKISTQIFYIIAMNSKLWIMFARLLRKSKSKEIKTSYICNKEGQLFHCF